MTIKQVQAENGLECSHCEKAGEISYAELQRQQKDLPAKVWVRNLPNGISQSGLSNLFLSIGEPLCISFNYKSRNALVQFNLMHEVELAIRDLNGQPPYYLKVFLATPKNKNELKDINNPPETDENIFSEVIKVEPIAAQDSQELSYAETIDDKVKEMDKKMEDVIKKVGYNPSLRMRQSKLDFKSESICISMGRGFLNMGSKDCFVGGLEKFECSSKGSEAKRKMSFSCKNCQALTTKICGSCSLPFCSKVCMKTRLVNHDKNCSSRFGNERLPEEDKKENSDESVEYPFPVVSLESECTVVMTSYFTMKTVYVRRCEKIWEEKFCKLMNDVAAEALKGKKLEEAPKLHDLVIARYHEDLCFYRAQVCGTEEEKISVFFVDFGNTQETLFEDLRVAPDYLKSEPGFAVKVQLKDVLELSSIECVDYFNNLTAESVPLTLKFVNPSEVILIEKETKTVVNETVFHMSLPSWKKDSSLLSKTGEVFYLDAIKSQSLDIGRSYNLYLSHFEEKEFLESEVFWMTNQDTDEYAHACSEMLFRITEYCEFLKDDWYLPRTNELCLAKENGKWHRCVNLKSQKTTCCLFFLEDGHSSCIDTNNIRKMVHDFTETPSQSICCILPDNPRLKDEKVFHSEVVSYLKNSLGQRIDSIRVLKLMGDAYCLSIPGINEILEKKENEK